jgi:hypothetical protein
MRFVRIVDPRSNCCEPLKGYLKEEFEKLLTQSGINEWIDGHIEFHSRHQLI